jgi:hypothetical protein
MPWESSRFTSRTKESIIVPLIYLILPNLPLWIFEKPMALSPHGYINVECLLVGILAFFVPRCAIFFVLLLEMCASFIYLVCYTYQFSLKTLWLSKHYCSLLPVGRVALIAAALAVVCLMAALVAECPRPRAGEKLDVLAILGLFVLVFIALDTVDGQNPRLPLDGSTEMPRVTISPIVELSIRELSFHNGELSARNSSIASMPSASVDGVGFLKKTSSSESPNVVLIVVESWGLFRNPRLAEAVTTPFQDPEILSRYQVSFGTAPFDGLTVQGEARELCHSHFGFGIMDISPAQARSCLPDMFHSRGYQNIAVHGYVGGMFRRNVWYKTIGFDQSWFGPDLDKVGLPNCRGAFPGICDGSIADWIGMALLPETAKRPRFIYWVTLNSHLPVSVTEKDLAPDTGDCSSHPELQDSKPLCSWFRLISQVHKSVRRLALEPQKRPTVFILVGDHAPPFADPHLHQLFSSEEVPYVILAPKPRSMTQNAPYLGD